MERQRAPPKGREAENGSRGIDSRGRIPESLQLQIEELAAAMQRIKRTIKKCESGKITKEQLQKSIQSWTGHAGHADSYNLRKKIETLAEAAIEKAA